MVADQTIQPRHPIPTADLLAHIFQDEEEVSEQNFQTLQPTLWDKPSNEQLQMLEAIAMLQTVEPQLMPTILHRLDYLRALTLPRNEPST